MKNQFLVLTLFVLIILGFNAQVLTPKASPFCNYQQKVGLTDIELAYSRPAVNQRIIFGELVPYNEFWRFGANENSKITISDKLIFGQDTLEKGTYAMFVKPTKESWDLVFYSDFGNWGMPVTWDENKVIFHTFSKVINANEKTENLSVTIDEINNNGASIVVRWDKVMVSFPFKVNSKEKVLASIEKTMKGPSANDYNQAATYYYNENLDLKTALAWSTKAVELRGIEAYWMTRMKSLLQAANGDYLGAIETANICIQEAEKDGDMTYVNMSKKSIEEWKNKK